MRVVIAGWSLERCEEAARAVRLAVPGARVVPLLLDLSTADGVGVFLEAFEACADTGSIESLQQRPPVSVSWRLPCVASTTYGGGSVPSRALRLARHHLLPCTAPPICQFSRTPCLPLPQNRARAEKWRLRLLVNNAGQFNVRGEVTEDGLERTFATNHVVRHSHTSTSNPPR